MSNHATIPYDVLALTYLRAAEQGRYPTQALRALGLSRQAASYRRTHMSKHGWLPKGDPELDARRQGRYDEQWLAQARQMIAERLRERRAWVEADLAHDAIVAQTRKIQAEYADGVERAARADHAVQARHGRGGPVLDVFF